MEDMLPGVGRAGLHASGRDGAVLTPRSGCRTQGWVRAAWSQVSARRPSRLVRSTEVDLVTEHLDTLTGRQFVPHGEAVDT